ncbi:23S rRNA (guanosine(2251)-2'-O)-methyltransferase RlmB [Patescibacteria group bacterium]|nr:23S rRNA (guanosine(2251)-2'-O)-methyltransferase RlmB [Patescibacteria group bacterium]
MKREHNKTYIYGKHALDEAIGNKPDIIRKVFLSSDIADTKLRNTLKGLNIPVATIKSKEAARMVGRDTPYQGVIAIVDLWRNLIDFSEFIAELKPSNDTALVILDELTDPQNVGAIIRSAAAFGISGVLIPSHNQAPITGAVVKASAGMAFRIPLVLMGNINYSISHLKEMGFKAYGLVMDGTHNLHKETFDAPALFVIGNEGSGIREKTLELCDVPLRVPMNPRCESLNAAASAAVVLYQWSAEHSRALK